MNSQFNLYTVTRKLDNAALFFRREIVLRGILLFIIGLSTFTVNADTIESKATNFRQIVITGMSLNRIQNGWAYYDLQYNTISVSPEEGNTLLPCSNCQYGLLYDFLYTGSGVNRPTPMKSCIRESVGSSNCYSVQTGFNTTYGEANALFIGKYNSSGSVTVRFAWELPNLRFCVGTNTSGLHQVTGKVTPLRPYLCNVVPVNPVSCNVTADNIDLDHGLLTNKQLMDTTTDKSVTNRINLTCTGNTEMSILFNPTLYLAPNLDSEITLKLNNKNVVANSSKTIIGGNTPNNIDITSTIKAKGKVVSGSYSSSAIIILNII